MQSAPKIKISFTLFFICCVFHLNARPSETIDSLKVELDNAEQSEKAGILIKISEKYVGENVDSALFYAEKGLEAAFEAENNSLEAEAYYLMGEALSEDNQNRVSIQYYEKAMEIYDEIHEEDNVHLIYTRLGLVYYYLGQYENAIDYQQQAIEYYLNQKDKTNLGKTYHNLGLIYNELKDPEKAVNFYEKAMVFYEEIGDQESIAALLQNLGVSYSQLDNNAKAIEHYTRSMEIYENLKNDYGIAISKVNIGNIHLKQQRIDNAIENFQTALAYFIQNDMPWETTLTYLDLGEAYGEKGAYATALEYLNRGLEMSKEHDYISNEAEFYKTISSVYEKSGDYKLAFEHYKNHSALDESIYRGESAKRIEELQARFNIVSKDNELSETEAELKQQRLQKFIYIAFLVLLVVLGLFLIINYRRKEKARRELEKHKRKLEKIIAKRTAELKTEISERKIAEESDKLKSAFLANMSHEIRTPMNAIISFSQFLKDPDTESFKKEEYINYIVSSGKTLLRLIDDIIDSAKIEANQLKIKRGACNVNTLMRELYRFFKESKIYEEKSKVELVINPENFEQNYIIQTDKVRLRQVLTNLIENGFKYTEEGYIEFGFRISRAQALIFYVKDTGIGIPDDKKAKIFDRFTRVKSSDDKLHAGFGLGLSISRDLVQLLGGKIWFQSEVNRGTTFYFSVPYNSIEEGGEHLDEDGGLNNKNYNWQSKRILVAEDDDLNFKILETILKRNHAEIIRAKNGKLAVEFSREKEFDLVLMDIQMPEMNGYDATREIKKINYRLPVIAQTAFAMREERDKCIEAGCDDYIVKPINISELQGKVSKYLV